jgi:fatty-acyl-CoA synthase
MPAGQEGLSGPWVPSQYCENARASSAAFVGEGWFHAGDVSTIDPDGFVQRLDRAKDLIKSGGEWISSIEIEAAAIGHPDLAEAGVIGARDPRWGERPLLIEVARKGSSPTGEQIKSNLAPRLPKLSLPNHIVFVEQLPRNATGKILKTELRKEFGTCKPISAQLWPAVPISRLRISSWRRSACRNARPSGDCAGSRRR